MIKKKLQIDIEIINSARSCIDNYKCLEMDSKELCEIKLSTEIGKDHQILLCKNGKACNFRADYYNLVCTYSACSCPVRKEIYYKYEQ